MSVFSSEECTLKIAKADLLPNRWQVPKPRHRNDIVLRSLRSAHKQRRSRDNDAENPEHNAKMPEHAAPREQRNRRYDQGNFKEDFGEVKAVGSPTLQFHFML
jgi:hypothetical protein